MRTNFDDFMVELEAEAKAEGPVALEQFHAFGRHFASIAAQIASLRREKHLTQQQLAAKTGIQQAEISRIEKGRGNPTLKTLAAIGTALESPIGFHRAKAAAKRISPKRKARRPAARASASKKRRR
jgi:XRE family transcriptional regulator, regulator of sulfur utilization